MKSETAHSLLCAVYLQQGQFEPKLLLYTDHGDCTIRSTINTITKIFAAVHVHFNALFRCLHDENDSPKTQEFFLFFDEGLQGTYIHHAFFERAFFIPFFVRCIFISLYLGSPNRLQKLRARSPWHVREMCAGQTKSTRAETTRLTVYTT